MRRTSNEYLQSRLGALLGSALALIVCVGIASDASAARKYRATGFSRANLGQINIPLQFVISGPGMTGGHSIHLGFPQDDIQDDFDITATGMSPAGIKIPGLIATGGSYSALAPLMGIVNVQITTMFTGTFPAADVHLMAGGGPGSLSFCPGAVPGVGAACPTTAGMLSTGFMAAGAPDLMAPPQGTGTRNGRIVYLGGGGYGGVVQTILGGSGLVTAPRPGNGFGSPTFQAGHRPINAGGMTGGVQAPGGPTSATATRMAGPFVYTQPKTAPATAGTISSMQAGPFLTVGSLLTSCPTTGLGGAYPNIPLTGCVVGTGPQKTASGATSTQTVFPFTTGTVIAQQTTNTAGNGVGDLVTITGSDSRTPNGIGNITIVAGNLVLRNALTSTTNTPFNVHSWTISEKTPSMSPQSMAAAAVLMLLVAGYALRNRF
jgi:hypothetical protein